MSAIRKINERVGDLSTAFRTFGEKLKKDIRTAIPAIIQSYDPECQTVTAQPAIREKISHDTIIAEINIPVLVDIPLVMPRAGGYSLVCAPKQGDECLLIFADDCIDAWWQSGGVQSQADERRHDLSDAFAILGTWSQPNKPEIPESGIRLQKDDGSAYVLVDGNTVSLKGDPIRTDGLEVGARNLLRFSLNPTITFTGGSGGYQRRQTVAEWGCTNAFRVYGTSGSSRAFYIGGLTATIANGKNVSESGQSYAMSVWVKNAHATNSVIVCTPLGGERTLAPGESARCAFVVEGDGLHNLEIDFKPTAPPSEYDVYFWHAKIEIGTVATDWLPAPEDADESYVALTGKPTENQTPGFGETVEVSQVKTDTGGRVTSLTARTIKIPDSEATQSAAGLMSAADKKRLDELEVGGRNLLLYSAEPIVYSAYSTINVTRNISVSEWGATDATRVAGGGGSNLYVCRVGGNTEDMAYRKNVGVNGKNYTISVWIKNNHATNRCGVRINLPYDPGYTMLNPGESMRVEQTAVGNGSTVLCIYFRTGNLGEDFDFTIWHPKIEEGTFATDWTPAVEEYAGEASVTFDSIRNTSNTTSNAGGTVRKVGKTVLLNFSAVLSAALSAGTWVVIGTLPSGYRPPEDVMSFLVCTTDTNPVYLRGYIASSTGSISVKTATALATGKQVVGSVTFFV